MKRLFLMSACALLAMAAMANAASVTFQAADNTTAPNAWSTKYGLYDYMVYDFGSGKPDVDKGYQTKTGSNPDFVSNFFFGTPGSSGGGGSGGGGQNGNTIAAGDLYYDLVLNEGKQFQFAALFYDSTYGTDNGLAGADVALRVRLLGLNDLDDAWHDITVAQLEAGSYQIWDVIVYDDDAVKGITLDVDFVNGAGAYAAGFFLDSVQDAGNAPATTGVVPEPATVGLVMFGLAGVFVRRKNGK